MYTIIDPIGVTRGGLQRDDLSLALFDRPRRARQPRRQSRTFHLPTVSIGPSRPCPRRTAGFPTRPTIRRHRQRAAFSRVKIQSQL